MVDVPAVSTIFELPARLLGYFAKIKTMGFTKALFYPSIDIEDEEWLKTAVLFWDEISTIVPQSFNNPYTRNTTQYLADEGLLTPVRVSPFETFIEELTTDVTNYMKTNEGLQMLLNGQNSSKVIQRNKLPQDVRELVEIHSLKWPVEIHGLLKDSLTKDGYFRVDGNFAMFYMTLLANKICEEKGIALLTNNPLSSNLSDKVKLDNQVVIERSNYNFYESERKEHYSSLAQGMLTNLIIESIRVSPETSLVDIVQFKKDQNHRDELGLFRSKIADLTNVMSMEGSLEAIKQQVQDIYNDQFLPAYNNLKRSLKGSGVKWLSDNFMKIAFISTTSTALPMALLGLSLPHALIAAAGISLVSSVVSYNEDKKEKIRSNPYSYLLAINKNI